MKQHDVKTKKDLEVHIREVLHLQDNVSIDLTWETSHELSPRGIMVLDRPFAGQEYIGDVFKTGGIRWLVLGDGVFQFELQQLQTPHLYERMEHYNLTRFNFKIRELIVRNETYRYYNARSKALEEDVLYQADSARAEDSYQRVVLEHGLKKPEEVADYWVLDYARQAVEGGSDD